MAARVGAASHPGDLAAAAGAFGLARDHLLAAEVMLADGRCLRVSRDTYPYFLRCLLAGAGNLGIVTAFEFRLRPVG